MITRVTDPAVLTEELAPYKDTIGDEFEANEWLGNDRNIALTDNNSFGLFQYEIPGVYTGHYFFSNNVRGKEAKRLATEMLIIAFRDYGIRVIRGLTPVKNKKARWMTRQLGFKSFGILDISDDTCELFILTRDDFIGKNNG